MRNPAGSEQPPDPPHWEKPIEGLWAPAKDASWAPSFKSLPSKSHLPEAQG